MKQHAENKQDKRIWGRGQLSLVEHALCPLDAKASLQSNLTHHSEFSFYDGNGHKKQANARVDAPNGLSANDEFYLWGLLALTFRQEEPGIEFRATPNYCLKQLGIPRKPGGKEYRLFRDALRRLAAVNYQCENFYDPIRSERCDISFGFMSYRLPLTNDSNRAWRIAWNPIFFDFCKASGGSLEFDLQIYQKLDQASRRLFLLLRKVFWRKANSPKFELRDLAVNVLGYSDALQTKHMKSKVLACAKKLSDLGIIRPEEGEGWVTRASKGVFKVYFEKGKYFETVQGSFKASLEDVRQSRFYEPLQSIGFDDPSIARIVRKYKSHLIDEWADITLAAIERKGKGFFKVSPQAFFTDSIKNAAAGTRGVPDWWHDLKRSEHREQAKSDRQSGKERASGDQIEARRAFAAYLKGDGRETFESLISTIFGDLKASGVDQRDAGRKARDAALDHMRKQFVGKQSPGNGFWQLLQ